MTQEEFINAGFTVLGTNDTENALLRFLREHYPAVVRDNEVNLQELKAALGLPIDEKVNGYGLNFVGRNVARAKYAQKTTKELRLNTALSKEFDTTQNLVLKGDNLDSLKILKSHYSSKIKCIYIDPPYNTTSDEFVYPDKFDKEEAEVLGFQNLSDDDFARMEFSFKTKKSHNGWLAFMYPRLLLARDLLSKDGVIFISIDDNEQANLKLLCDDVFGEENFVANFQIKANPRGRQSDSNVATLHDYLLCYGKNFDFVELNGIPLTEEDIEEFDQSDENGKAWRELGLRQRGSASLRSDRPEMFFPIYVNPQDLSVSLEKTNSHTIPVIPKKSTGVEGRWMWGIDKVKRENSRIYARLIKRRNEFDIFIKDYLERNDEVRTKKPKSMWAEKDVNTEAGGKLVKLLFGSAVFSYPKPIGLIKRVISLIANSDDIILDFFAGSGTTGHAVMQLNAEDGGKRKFILCQKDEQIKEDKPAYKFCLEHGLPPVISSITIERLRRAGEKIAKEIEEANTKEGLFDGDKKHVPDVGFKVFDSVEAPTLAVDETTLQIAMIANDIDAMSRIYNMIFTVGLDEPTCVPAVVVEDCIYKIGNHYYITNSDRVSKEDFAEAVKSGKVFIDGWTASLNGTLQNYKEDVKIIF
ncbi:MAG: site-specific DNA-methyltransferase [Candidatus Kapabacteria bacterium]|jgi:adenine-specific DNA-methyltransferase|nr:site-specific DNA-methyltransferase [Candidatus Kapabacteria bacterium]